jgi:cell division protein FtsQ
MPAAVRGGRRGAPSARPKGSAASARPRAKRPAPAAVRPSRPPGASRRIPLKFIASGLGVFFIVGAVAVLATGGRGEALASDASAAALGRLTDSGLRVDAVHLQGASPPAQKEIMKAAALKQGSSILTLDLDAVRRRVEQVGWVNRARVIRLWPDTVVIAVDERPLVAIWEHNGRAVVVASDGTVVDKADPARFASLPLIVGEGANTAAAPIVSAVSSRPRLADKLEALVRVDDRRWDLRLKEGTLVQLPADGEEEALIRLDQLDRKSRILDLGLARIDLRDPEMVVVRPRAGPAANLESHGV